MLDGPMGTELGAAGVAMPAPGWSAPANASHAELVQGVHRAYAAAGATVHTANTFRTTARGVGPGWRALATLAVDHARRGVPVGHLVAGSIAPLEDCYRPDLSPPDPRPEHRAAARHLAACGVDLLLVETFAHVGEALVAVEEAAATGLPVWAALCPAPDASLLTPRQLHDGARAALDAGATRVLVNCVDALRATPYVEALASLGAPFGVYANAGDQAHGLGWDGDHGAGAVRYAALARRWLDLGATCLGGCCGTGPAHVRAIADLVGGPVVEGGRHERVL